MSLVLSLKLVSVLFYYAFPSLPQLLANTNIHIPDSCGWRAQWCNWYSWYISPNRWQNISNTRIFSSKKSYLSPRWHKLRDSFSNAVYPLYFHVTFEAPSRGTEICDCTYSKSICAANKSLLMHLPAESDSLESNPYPKGPWGRSIQLEFWSQETIHIMLQIYSFYSCPEQLNRWPCHSLTHSLTNGTFTFDITEWP